MSASTFAELGESIEHAIVDVLRLPVLQECRDIANEAGIHKARQGLHDALAGIGTAQDEFRVAQAHTVEAKDDHADLLAEAEWALAARFVVEGNKVYLVEGDERRAMTADERSAWKAREALRDVKVKAAEIALRATTEAEASKRDALALAERRFSACKAELAASVALLQTLTRALPGKDAE